MKRAMNNISSSSPEKQIAMFVKTFLRVPNDSLICFIYTSTFADGYARKCSKKTKCPVRMQGKQDPRVKRLVRPLRSKLR